MNEEGFKYILMRVVDNGNSALEEGRDSEYQKGRLFAYYEVLDTIKNELSIGGEDLNEYGLARNLEREFL